MKKVINESKKIKELELKIKKVFNEVNDYSNSYKSLEKENQNIKKEIKTLKYKNKQLEEDNKNLTTIIKYILERIKMFFRNILLKGNSLSKDLAVEEVKNFYDYEDFKDQDIIDIAHKTEKEDELFDYANIPDYYKTYNEEEYIDDDYNIEI